MVSMIGIFDSGSGGLSVLRAVRERAPKADIVYFGDLKNAPYGNKKRTELDALTAHGFQTLLDNGATHIVSACNSVSVSSRSSCEACQLSYKALIEMVGPTVQRFENTKAHVLVLATKATIESEIYQTEFNNRGIKADGVALPELVQCIENGAEKAYMQRQVRETLENNLQSEHTHTVLGCTHFPLVRDVFEHALQELEKEAIIVDPAEAVADAVVARFDTKGEGTTRILLSAESEVFKTFLTSLFPEGVSGIEVI